MGQGKVGRGLFYPSAKVLGQGIIQSNGLEEDLPLIKRQYVILVCLEVVRV